MKTNETNNDCPVCESQNLKFCFSCFDILYRVVSDRYSIYKCSKCQAFFINPFPSQEETKFFYPKNYYSYNTEGGTGFFSKLRKNIISFYFEPDTKIGLINRICVILSKNKFSGIPLYKKNGGYFLDIGCGKGENLMILKKYGWNVFGIELDANAVGYAQKNGLNVQNLSLEEVDYGLTKFDSIRIWHVFEHLTNPNVALEKIKNLLNHNAEIMMAVPNTKSFARLLFGKYWYGLDVPRHIINYSPKTIKYILNKHGLVDEKVIYSSCGSFVASISNFLRRKFGYGGNLIDNFLRVNPRLCRGTHSV